MKTRKRKNILIVALVVTMLFMSVAYAILSQELVITGNTKISGSLWQVEITGISVVSSSGEELNSNENFTLTSATFDTELFLPGDSVKYNITIENKGAVDAKLQSVMSNMNNLMENQPLIKYQLENANVGTVLATGDTMIVALTVSYDTNVIEEVIETINQQLNITFNFVQE